MSLCLRATLPGEDAAFKSLSMAIAAVAAGEAQRACRLYHEATASMLASGARRVSGDLWKDQLIHIVLHAEHPFAKSAARGERDEAMLMCMAEEMDVLGELSELTSEMFARMAIERQGARQGHDGISAMSEAVWQGMTPQKSPRAEETDAPVKVPLCFTPWSYGEAGMSGGCVADESLEEIYRRLIADSGWGRYAEDAYNLFASCGSGEFLCWRGFYAGRTGALSPLPEYPPLTPVSLYEAQHVALMENTISFMRGERACSMLLYGEAGCGKTAHVMSLLNELPEVRLIALGRDGLSALPDIMERIAGQPLKFILLLDDIDPDSSELRQTLSWLWGMGAQPQNALVYATSRKPSDRFELSCRFAYPSLPQFETLIAEIMEADGAYADKQAVHNAAVDHQVDARERLAFAGARRVALRLEK